MTKDELRKFLAKYKPKTQYTQKTDAIKNNKPVVVKPVKYKPKSGESIVNLPGQKPRIVRRRNEVVSTDNRSNAQRRLDWKKDEQTKQYYQQQKNNQAFEDFTNAITKLYSPSTYVGAAARSLTGDGTFGSNLTSGTGFNNPIANIAFDLATPVALKSLQNPISKLFNSYSKIPFNKMSYIGKDLYRNTPQYVIKHFAKTNTGKRLAEVAMRGTSAANPIPILQDQLRYILHNDKRRGFDILKYIISGKKTGPFGRYNSMTPFENGQYRPYTGFLPNENHNAIIPDANDLIDAYLYNKQIDSRYGLIYKGKGSDFGVHEKYIKNNYPERYSNVQVYETTPSKEYLYDGPPVKENWNMSNDHERLFNMTQGPTPNVGGHLESAPNLFDPPFKGQDIWKFKPDEYMKKWKIENPIIKAGLTFIDNAGTPVVIKTPWLNNM